MSTNPEGEQVPGKGLTNIEKSKLVLKLIEDSPKTFPQLVKTARSEYGFKEIETRTVGQKLIEKGDLYLDKQMRLCRYSEDC